MTDKLRLITSDPAVWEFTLEVIQHEPRRCIDIRCKVGGCRLGRVCDTNAGLVLTSKWANELEPPIITSPSLTRQQNLNFLERRFGWTPGDPALAEHGVIALLRPPDHLPDAVPDLLVRCNSHGDAVLDRDEIAQWFSGPGPDRRKIAVGKPFHPYVEPMVPQSPTL